MSVDPTQSLPSIRESDVMPPPIFESTTVDANATSPSIIPNSQSESSGKTKGKRGMSHLDQSSIISSERPKRQRLNTKYTK